MNISVRNVQIIDIWYAVILLSFPIEESKMEFFVDYFQCTKCPIHRLKIAFKNMWKVKSTKLDPEFFGIFFGDIFM